MSEPLRAIDIYASVRQRLEEQRGQAWRAALQNILVAIEAESLKPDCNGYLKIPLPSVRNAELIKQALEQAGFTVTQANYDEKPSAWLIYWSAC